jgi:hypothetical protein
MLTTMTPNQMAAMAVGGCPRASLGHGSGWSAVVPSSFDALMGTAQAAVCGFTSTRKRTTACTTRYLGKRPT